MQKSKMWWIITGLLAVFVLSIIISADFNKEVIDYTDYEKGTIVQTSEGIKVDGNWYYFDEWELEWKNNNPVLTKKGTHSFLGENEVIFGVLVGLAAAATGTYAYILQNNEKLST